MSSTFFKIRKIIFSGEKSIVGVGVLDDPSGKSDLDGLIFSQYGIAASGGWDVEDAVPYIF